MQRSMPPLVLAVLFLQSFWPVSAQEPIRVVVWDEQQPKQKTAYENYLGNQIADYLNSRPGLLVSSAKLNDPEQGLSNQRLDHCDVLVWWGHVRQNEVSAERGKHIVDQIRKGKLGFIALHSAHWSTPFVEAMKFRTRQIAQKKFTSVDGEEIQFKEIPPARQYFAPKVDSPLTPSFRPRKFPGFRTIVEINMPNCCFPAYRPDGKPSTCNVLLRSHPIANGIPKTFDIAETEMYDEPFHVPAPDNVVIEERWNTGEWFRSGSVWHLEKGKLFYFRPGHETFSVYKQEIPLKIVENAVRWMGRNN